MKETYRDYINDEFAARRARNRFYSLRAFARDLGVAADQLSAILKKRYGMSRSRAHAVAAKLGLSGGEAEHFCNLVEKEHGRSKAARQAADRALDAQKAAAGSDACLPLDAFKSVADWHHFAILELAEVDGNRLREASLAKRLGIPRAEAKAAVGRLKRLDLLEETAGYLAATTRETYAPVDNLDRSKRRFLGQLAELGVQALDRQSPEERNFTADLMAFSKADLDELRETVRQFRRAVAAIALRPGKKDSVYCVNTQCFVVAT